jgi:Asp-tRNA(Asn)/Glu-tRNA(Gln) amidotransferase A subunit family amidase
MPVCIQVVAHAYEDEVALGIMKQLEKQIGYKHKSAKELKL